jgi:hypothetical protein
MRTLGLSFGTHNCPGWSSSGGPHVKVEQSMQQLVWTSVEFTGPGIFSGALARAEVDPRWDYYRDVAVLAVPAGEFVARDAILDLGAAMQPDGRLVWQAPAGRWTILRFGHTTTAHINGTAPVSGQGLECDKLSREALDAFWAGYPAELVTLAGAHAGRTFTRLEIDSYEAGPQDWTPAMFEEFRRRRGYELRPWLATWAGHTLESAEITERFRSDWKRTVTELFAENYYGHMTGLAHRVPGLDLLVQPYATGRAPFDPLAIGRTGDLLMCEFWQKPARWGWDSIKPTASAAHRSGKRLVLAEAFTGQPQYAWRQDPFALKSTGDRAFCAGVNQFVLHASAHNPWPDAPPPGMMMGWWGTQFGPGQTWWEHGGPEWLAYLARCQQLLRQGVPVADLCYLLNAHGTPKPVSGYDYDIIGEHELLNRLSVHRGRLTLPDGTDYAALVLPETDTMLPRIAERIRQLVRDGATVIGRKPVRSPSLEDYPACDAEVARIAGELWGVSDDGSERLHGRARVVWGLTPAQVLVAAGIGPDVRLEIGSPLLWTHRRLPDTDIYFVSNQSDLPISTTVGFRIRGRSPELWDADTAAIRAVSPADWSPSGDHTDIHLTLDPSGSVFVVFRESSAEARTDAPSDSPTAVVAPVVLTIEGPWEMRFPPDRGAPQSTSLERLISWSEHPEPGVKHFSGTATYVKEIDLPPQLSAQCEGVTIDLGEVRNVAEVRINDHAFPALWKPPFRTDITKAIRPGKNRIEIRVTNLWPNRLIGDEQEPDDADWGESETFTYVEPPLVVGRRLLRAPRWLLEGRPRPSAGRQTFATYKFFTADSPLLPSGLLGPVLLEIRSAP